ncbi:tetratricopeptide repeat protein [Rhodocaloribacter sp.]
MRRAGICDVWRWRAAFLLAGLLLTPAAHLVAAQTPEEMQAERIFVRGMTRAYLDDHEAALRFYQEALRLTPNRPAILSAVAASHAALDDVPTAIFYAEQARALDPANVYYHRQVAELYERSGDVARAAAAYDTLLAAHPGDTRALLALARLQAARGRLEDALDVFERLRARSGDDPEVLAQMLELYSRLGDRAGIEATLRTLIRLAPDAAYRRMLGELYVREGRMDDAAALYEALLEDDPSDVETLLALSDLYRRTGRTGRADSLLDRSMRDEHATADQILARAEPFLERAASDPAAAAAARRLLHRALAREPQHYEALRALGELLFETGDYAEAEARLYEALRHNPRDPALWTRAATAALFAGRPLRAAEIADEGLILFPGHVDLLRAAALGYLDAYRNEDALARFEEALDLLDEAPDGDARLRADLLAGLGMIYTRRRDFHAADSLYARALAVDPDHAVALNNLAYSLAERGLDLDRALDLARRALDLAPENPSFMDTLGWVYLQRDDLENAEKWLGRAVGGGGTLALEHYGDLQARLGRLDAAREYWQRAFERRPESAALRSKLERLRN